MSAPTNSNPLQDDARPYNAPPPPPPPRTPRGARKTGRVPVPPRPAQAEAWPPPLPQPAAVGTSPQPPAAKKKWWNRRSKAARILIYISLGFTIFVFALSVLLFAALGDILSGGSSGSPTAPGTGTVVEQPASVDQQLADYVESQGLNDSSAPGELMTAALGFYCGSAERSDAEFKAAQQLYEEVHATRYSGPLAAWPKGFLSAVNQYCPS